MLKNEVTLLKKENEEQSIKLKQDDSEIIKNIMKSMSIFKVNSYDSQVIRRDLIGMAQELNLRDSNLEESIGDNIKNFATEIINNSNGPSKIEIFLNFLTKLSGFLFIWFVALTFWAFGGSNWNVNPKIYFYYIGAVLIMFIIEGIITPIYSTEKGIKKRFPSFISIISFLILTTAMYFIDDSQYTNTIDVKYIIVTSGLVYIISKYFNTKNIHKLSKNKRNFIEDLK